MKKIINNYTYKVFGSLSICVFALFLGCETDETQTVATFNNLVWADEFDVNGYPDPTRWSFDTGVGPLNDGWGNNELQYYTDREENATVQNGFLIITALNESFNDASYTSARLKTRNLLEQQYGRFEARIRLPWGEGLFPAFWMLGSNFCEAQSFVDETMEDVFCDTSDPAYEEGNVLWPQSGEIDIMEFIGDEPTEVFGTIHGPGFSAGESISKSYTLPNGRFDTSFHVFGVEWTADYINWYVDGDLYNQITRQDVEEEGGTWVFDNSFYMLLNLAVGGNLPGAPGNDTEFPQNMLIDYVRVYN